MIKIDHSFFQALKVQFPMEFSIILVLRDHTNFWNYISFITWQLGKLVLSCLVNFNDFLWLGVRGKSQQFINWLHAMAHKNKPEMGFRTKARDWDSIDFRI
jgi:hypothetical protein